MCAEAGQTVFRKLCAQCHSIYGEGGTLGPDITSNGRASFEQLLSNVFDPSLVIGPAYQTTTVVTEDGRNLTGLLSEDNDQRLVLLLPGGAKDVNINAGLDKVLGGLNSFYLLLDKPETYGLPSDPKVPSKSVLRSTFWSIFTGLLVTLGVLFRFRERPQSAPAPAAPPQEVQP